MGVDKDGKPTEDEEPDTGATDESQDDQDEEADDSAEGSDSSANDNSDESEDEEEEKPSLFFNPNKLPPELKPVFKRMQASFTRKMQALSDERKTLGPKAAAFDNLVADAGFRQWYESRQNGGAGEDDEAGDGSSTVTDPHMARRMQALERRDLERQAAMEFKDFTAKHPEWENYQADMTELMEKNPSLTYEDAFKLATYEDAQKNGSRARLDKLGAKRRANSNKPSSSQGDVPPPRARSVQEAFNMAKKQLGVR